MLFEWILGMDFVILNPKLVYKVKYSLVGISILCRIGHILSE
jgi:hypothetical protein